MAKLLMFLTAFVAITAIPCGIMLMIQPDGHLLQLNSNLISQSFLHNYLVPGIALTFFVGCINLYAAFKLWKKHYRGAFWAGAGGLMIIAFEVVQISVIQTYDWLQFVYLLLGFFIVLMALQVKHKELI